MAHASLEEHRRPTVSRETIRGQRIPGLAKFSQLVGCVPGSSTPERIALSRVILTEAGELAFITPPFMNLRRARQPYDHNAYMRDYMRRWRAKKKGEQAK
jgi:hypothetical protein